MKYIDNNNIHLKMPSGKYVCWKKCLVYKGYVDKAPDAKLLPCLHFHLVNPIESFKKQMFWLKSKEILMYNKL
jgi:hypothetical protein